MDYKRTWKGIEKYLGERWEDKGAYEDALALYREWIENDIEEGYKYGEEIKKRTINGMQRYAELKEWDGAERLRRIVYELYKTEAPYKFDSYCLALEYDRPIEEQFYYPRREVLKKFVQELQRLTDGELEELFLSCPPRIGKTTLLLFYTTWMMGRDGTKSNLYSSFSDIITQAFYNGILEVLQDKSTYHWGDIFTGHGIAKGGTNAANETVDIDRKKHYPSLTCRSLSGTLNGACDCSGLLIADDTIGGIEEAMNKDRLISAWSKVDNNLLARAKGQAKILWVGTRWSLIDPIGLRQDLLENNVAFKDRKYKIINIPALNENDESNFDYKYGVGFSTEMYKQRRASFERNNDIASWNAQYMGMPIEREGTVFSPGDMRFYNGVLPDETPDRIFMAVDPAFGGGDFVASPVCVQYGNDIYVPDVVYSNAEKNITQPLLGRTASKYGVTVMQIEANKAVQPYVEGVQKELQRYGAKTTLQSKAAGTGKSKEQRIFDRAPDIREHFIFLESGKRSKEYELFMQNVFSFKIQGNNKHDDAPDSLGMAADMSFRTFSNQISVFNRPF